VVLKVSWDTSAKSVRHECEVFKHLEKYNVRGVEKCLSLCQYIEPKNNINTAPNNVLTKKSNSMLTKDSLYFPFGTVMGGQTGVLGGPTNLGVHNVIMGEINFKNENKNEKKDTSFLVRLYNDEEKREEAEILREKKYKDEKLDEIKMASIESGSGFLEKLYTNDEKNEAEEKIRENNFFENEKNNKNIQSSRVMMVLKPFFQSNLASKSTLQDIETVDIKSKAVSNLILTMVEMLNAGVAGSDLQPLINIETGTYIYICAYIYI
jgi:hypothetical protein